MQATVFVDKFYEMDPQFEDLIPEGTQLRDGMIVLLEDSTLRSDPDALLSKYDEERMREVNRWCTVSELTVRRRFDRNEMGDVIDEASPLISFIAIYADGTKKKRTYDASYAWIVKLESISQTDERI